MPKDAVALALAVKRGEVKIESLSKEARKKVEFVIGSGSIDHMTGRAEGTVRLPRQRIAPRLRHARAR